MRAYGEGPEIINVITRENCECETLNTPATQMSKEVGKKKKKDNMVARVIFDKNNHIGNIYLSVFVCKCFGYVFGATPAAESAS
jgi:hypothetical protein